jgi:hypothetical protein
MGRPPILGTRPLTNSEKHKRYMARLRARAEAHGTPVACSEGKGVTVTVSEHWREQLTNEADRLGVPLVEFVDFITWLGALTYQKNISSGRKMQKRVAGWLIEMRSKYPGTFNVGAWEGSCGHLALDKLYGEQKR